MPDKDSANPTQPQTSEPSVDPTSKRLEEEADEMAGAASKTEQRYDQDHGIFTK